MKKCPKSSVNTGLLVLRIGVGAIFIFAGWMKVSDLHGTVTMFAGMGFNAFWAYVASFVELLGGIAVLLGIFTRGAAFLLMITMIVALYKVHADPAMLMTPLAMFFATLALSFTGAGTYSLMRKMCGCEGTCGACPVDASKNTQATK